jgi:hypothetical protein
MKYVFLLGGLGNNLFQLTKFPEAKYCSLLILPWIRILLRHTVHEDLIPIKLPVLAVVGLPLILLDFMLAFLMRKSLFTLFDLRKFNAKPIFPVFAIGYFQDDIHINRIRSKIALQTLQSTYESNDLDAPVCVIHVRSGDILDPNTVNPYGELAMKYYAKALDEFCPRDISAKIVVHTDNAERTKLFVDEIKEIISIDRDFEIRVSRLSTMIKDSLNATVFVSGNSTLSVWISAARTSFTHEAKTTVCPYPLLLNKNFSIELPVQYILRKQF